MTQEAWVVGVDVSKATLDVMILPLKEAFTVANTAEGWRKLIGRLRGHPVKVVAFEGTGGYQNGLWKALWKAGLPTALVNAKRVRDFARASGIQAKNDKLDALMIARFAAMMKPRLTLWDPVREVLAELVAARRQITEEITRTSNQAEHTTLKVIERMNKRTVVRLKADLKILEAEIAKIIDADETLARRSLVMRSAPGVGPVSSATFAALLPELGQVTDKAIASLVGVAPFDHDSGKLQGVRCISGGRQPVRDVLYMAALSATRAKGPFQAFYKSLVGRGKPPKLAIVALMRPPRERRREAHRDADAGPTPVRWRTPREDEQEWVSPFVMLEARTRS